jgi:hypothetical protein
MPKMNLLKPIKTIILVCALMMVSMLVRADNSWLSIVTFDLLDTPSAPVPHLVPQNDSTSIAWTQNATIDIVANDNVLDDVAPQLLTNVSNGQLTLTGRQVQYQPNPEFVGAEIVEYKLVSMNGTPVTSDIATITINVVEADRGAAPVAVADEAHLLGDNATITLDVLANDTDSDGAVLIVESITSAANGQSTLVNGVVSYTPNSDFCGDDSFSYTIRDELYNRVQGIVNVSCHRLPSIPVMNQSLFSVNARLLTQEAFTVLTQSTVTDSRYSLNELRIQLEPNSHKTYDNIAHSDTYYGQTDTVYAAYNTLDPRWAEFKNQILFHSSLSSGVGMVNEIRFRVINPEGNASNWATLRVSLDTAFNGDYNYTPAPDNFTVSAEQASTLEVLNNDPAVQSTYKVAIYQDPKHGQINLSSDKKSFIYTPNQNYSGSDEFYYRVYQDGGGLFSSSGQVSLMVGEVPNTPPVAVNDSMARDSTTASVLVDVLANDSDPENAALTLFSVSSATNGSTVIEQGKVNYTANQGYCGTDSFTYVVKDELDLSAQATVTITCNLVSNAPKILVSDVKVNAGLGRQYIFDVTRLPFAQDSQFGISELKVVLKGGDPATVLDNRQDVNETEHKFAVINVLGGNYPEKYRGKILYSRQYDKPLAPGQVDEIEYKIYRPDGTASETWGKLSVSTTMSHIQDYNYIPVADEATTTMNTSVDIFALDNDPDKLPGYQARIYTLPQQGTVTENNQTSFTYTPNAGFVGTDFFYYAVYDSEHLDIESKPVKVTITVTGEPVADNQPQEFYVSPHTTPNGNVEIRWKPPVTNGVVSYVLAGELKGLLLNQQMSPGGDGFIRVQRPAGAEGRSYCYKVAALYSGENVTSANYVDTQCTVVSANGQVALDAVQNLSIGAVSEQAYNLSWTGVSNADKYLVELQTKQSPTGIEGNDWQAIAYTSSTSIPLMFSEFHQSIYNSMGRFTYRVSACTSAGICGDYQRTKIDTLSASAFLATVPAEHKVPACIHVPPSVLEGASFSVEFCPTQATDVSSYDVYGELAGIISSGSLANFGKSKQGLAKLIRSGLTAGKEYCYKLAAMYGESRSAYTETRCIDVGNIVFDAPASFQAVSSGVENQYNLIWKSVVGAYSYKMERETSYGVWTTITCNATNQNYAGQAYVGCPVSISSDQIIDRKKAIVYRVSACTSLQKCGSYSVANIKPGAVIISTTVELLGRPVPQ